VTQEVLVKVVTKLSTFKGESAFRTFLVTVNLTYGDGRAVGHGSSRSKAF